MKKSKRKSRKKSFLERVLSLVDNYFAPYIESNDTDSQQEAVKEVVKSLADSGVFVANKSNMPGKMTADIYLSAVNDIDGVIIEQGEISKEKMN